MFIAHDKNGTRITAKEAQKGTYYFCPVCGSPVTFKSGSVKTPHFSHHRIMDCVRYLYKKESLAHLDAKHTLYLALNRHPVAMEYYLKEIEQIPDLLIDRTRALEIQYSTISPELIVERSRGYHSLGMEVIWLLDEAALRINAGCIIPTHFQLSTVFNASLFSYSNKHGRLKRWTLLHHRGGSRYTYTAEVLAPDALAGPLPAAPVAPIRLDQDDIRRMIRHARRQKSRLNPTLTFLYQLGLDPENLPAHLCHSVEAERWIMNPPLEWKLYIMHALDKGTFDWNQFSRFIRLRTTQQVPDRQTVLRSLIDAYKSLYISQ
ncbi:hypothetical protein FO441_00540 [Salinicoccus cyprini]|uniref:Competence protein CoiA n=1 Tax=Salinicoccus cyprini TaxID=2493691 RepID=A0A558AX21_9STAP|nr:competence protein CoiA family protein [Salinicoccus cyprini]TVT28799.1 hypothetical protein FO441_00540 [Salinicoccus cyprini]